MNNLYESYIVQYGAYRMAVHPPLTKEEFTLAIRIYQANAKSSSTIGAVTTYAYNFTKSFREGNLINLYIKEQLEELINE